jgi:LacI family transcriptional regulator
LDHQVNSKSNVVMPPDGPAVGSPSARPTIAHVAERAGVSVGTASKALNGRGQLKESTRERVWAAARDLSFVPSAQAQNLVRGRSFAVGLLTTDSFGRFSGPVMRGIEDAMGAEQLSLFLCDVRGDAIRERHYVQTLIARRVDGLIVTGRRTDPRTPIAVGAVAPVPVVYAYVRSSHPEDPAVVPDDEQGGRLAIEHLLDVGRRRIAHVTGPTRFLAVRERLKGMRAALSDAGVDLPESLVLPGAWSEAWGREAVDLIVAERVDVDAIFCGSDQIARGISDALRDRKIRVPDDIALVGFDNWEILANEMRPPLTTIDMNLEKVGRVAGERLLAIVGGAEEHGVQKVPCQLIVRESSGSATLRERPSA